jgi:hypothetical protein
LAVAGPHAGGDYKQNHSPFASAAKKFDFEITLPERSHPVEASQFANVSPVFEERIAPLWFMENALVGQCAQLVGRP